MTNTNNISELLQKLKNALAEELRSHEEQHSKYLVSGQRSISRAELAEEIEVGTDFGIALIGDAISLAIEMIATKSSNVEICETSAFKRFTEACDELQLAILDTCVNGGDFCVWDWVNGEPLPKSLPNIEHAKVLIEKVRELHRCVPDVWTYCHEPISLDDFRKMYIDLYSITGHKMYGMENVKI